MKRLLLPTALAVLAIAGWATTTTTVSTPAQTSTPSLVVTPEQVVALMPSSTVQKFCASISSAQSIGADTSDTGPLEAAFANGYNQTSGGGNIPSATQVYDVLLQQCGG